jgi:hypothetical protein
MVIDARVSKVSVSLQSTHRHQAMQWLLRRILRCLCPSATATRPLKVKKGTRERRSNMSQAARKTNTAATSSQTWS